MKVLKEKEAKESQGPFPLKLPPGGAVVQPWRPERLTVTNRKSGRGAGEDQPVSAAKQSCSGSLLALSLDRPHMLKPPSPSGAIY